MTRYADLTLGGFAEALAAQTATPGGGSASAVAASLAAALISMVARLSQGRPRYEAHADLHREAIELADGMRLRFLELADDDARAYEGFMAAAKQPRETPEQQAARSRSLEAAARQAAQVPLDMVRQCHRLMEVIEKLVGRSNINAASDLDVAALLLEAAARGAAANVVVNLDLLSDAALTGTMLREQDERLARIQATASRVREGVRSGQGSRPRSS